MNIKELLEELKKRNISLTGRAISEIWGMEETSFSKKKREGTQIKQKNIMQIEKALGIKLIKQETSMPANTLKRCFIADIEERQKDFGSRLEFMQNINNLTNFQTAGLLNLTETEYIELKNGVIAPDIKILNNMKQNFDISIDWLLYGE